MTDEFDIHRSEGEGMLPMDPDHQYSVYDFLDKVQDRFAGNHSLKHLEDAATSVIGEMEDDGAKKYFEGIGENLSVIMESFLGPKTWEIIQKAERDRILEFDLHDAEGTG